VTGTDTISGKELFNSIGKVYETILRRLLISLAKDLRKLNYYKDNQLWIPSIKDEPLINPIKVQLISELRTKLNSINYESLTDINEFCEKIIGNKVLNFLEKELLKIVNVEKPETISTELIEIEKEYASYIKNGSLLRKVLNQKELLLPEDLQPIHIRLLKNTEFQLTTSLESGMSYEELSTELANNIFGINYELGQLHPALPNPITGIVKDEHYGELPGYAKPDNPNGIMGDLKRLVRTETSYAENEIEYETAKESEIITGYQVIESSLACPICSQIIQSTEGGLFYFRDEEENLRLVETIFREFKNNRLIPTVKPPFHPNCFGAIGGYLYD
jgi:hypothetical protein